jgi:hypothetical protein
VREELAVALAILALRQEIISLPERPEVIDDAIPRINQLGQALISPGSQSMRDLQKSIKSVRQNWQDPHYLQVWQDMQGLQDLQDLQTSELLSLTAEEKARRRSAYESNLKNAVQEAITVIDKYVDATISIDKGSYLTYRRYKD